MNARTTRRPVVVAAVSVALVLAGCESGEREDAASGPAGSTVAPDISVTIPPQRLTPFCQGMIDLTDRLLNDPPDDAGAEIISAYESLVDVVPPEIEAEFLTVLARLQSGAPATTTTVAVALPGTTVADPDVTEPTTLFADEGYDPDEDPALRVNEYVQFACRDSVNNPGPAATQPGQTVAP